MLESTLPEDRNIPSLFLPKKKNKKAEKEKVPPQPQELENKPWVWKGIKIPY